ncbi:hypothetical protein NMY22_g1748 [Coprinellus aureogranulatus]|nr:hypothetical protein NMY22_g1748 [Coprinellus aureogranulatus]
MNKLTGSNSALNGTITHDVIALLSAVYDSDIVTRRRVDLNVLPVVKSTRGTVDAVIQTPCYVRGEVGGAGWGYSQD